MALSPCNTTVDGTRRELVEHGTTVFPIACYHDDLGEGEVPWHWHEELEAVVISEGCCCVAIGKEKYTIRSGEGFFVNSGVLHGCWGMEGLGCRFHSMVFHARLVGGSLDSVFYQNYVLPLMENQQFPGLHLTPEVPWQRQALEAMENAWQAGVREPTGYEFRVRSCLSELVLALWANVPAARPVPSGRSARDGERIKLMLQYIHDHFAEPLDLKAIAASASLSQSEALRCFRSTIGTTPIQYVRQFRISRAARLLTETDGHVADIAGDCGFTDVSYFTKTFREMKGCAPMQYRKNREFR